MKEYISVELLKQELGSLAEFSDIKKAIDKVDKVQLQLYGAKVFAKTKEEADVLLVDKVKSFLEKYVTENKKILSFKEGSDTDADAVVEEVVLFYFGAVDK